jgi:hypothetical protein
MLPGIALADVCPPGHARPGGCSPHIPVITPYVYLNDTITNIIVPILISGFVNSVVLLIAFPLLGKRSLIDKKFIFYVLSVTAVGAITDLIALFIIGTNSLLAFFSAAFILLFIFNYLLGLLFYRDFKVSSRLIIALSLAFITNPCWLMLIQQ